MRVQTLSQFCSSACLIRDKESGRGGQRERERETESKRETERQRDRETERQRDRETERQRDRETEREREREREKLCVPDTTAATRMHRYMKTSLCRDITICLRTGRDRERDRERERQRERDRERDRELRESERELRESERERETEREQLCVPGYPCDRPNIIPCYIPRAYRQRLVSGA